jgi:hypothetical protein
MKKSASEINKTYRKRLADSGLKQISILIPANLELFFKDLAKEKIILQSHENNS